MTKNLDTFQIGDFVMVTTKWGHYSLPSKVPLQVPAKIVSEFSGFFICEGTDPLPPENDVPGARRMGPYVAAELKRISDPKIMEPSSSKEGNESQKTTKRRGFFL